MISINEFNELNGDDLYMLIKSRGHTILSFSKLTNIPKETIKVKLEESNLYKKTKEYSFYGYKTCSDKAKKQFEILESILHLCEIYY